MNQNTRIAYIVGMEILHIKVIYLDRTFQQLMFYLLNNADSFSLHG